MATFDSVYRRWDGSNWVPLSLTSYNSTWKNHPVYKWTGATWSRIYTTPQYLPTATNSEVQSYIGWCDTLPSSSYITALDTLVSGLKTDGNWTKLDRLWIFAAETQQASNLNIVNPSIGAVSPVSTTWAANKGYIGDGSTSYINTNFNPKLDSIAGVSYSNSYGLYVNPEISTITGKIYMGGNHLPSGNYSWIYVFNSTSIFAAINSAWSDVGTTKRNGFISAKRTSSSAFNYYNNDIISSTQSSSTANSDGLVNGNQYIFNQQYNNSPYPGQFLGGTVSIAYFGGALDVPKLYTRIQTFATTIGFNI